MISFIKKDLLVFWRDRKEILLSLLLPIGIILILNFAMSGLLEDGAESIEIDVAITQEDNEAIGMEQFKEKINQMDLSRTEKEAILAEATEISPIGLINDLFQNPEVENWIKMRDLNKEEAKKAVKEGELDAIITIPEGFTSSTLSSILLGEEADEFLVINVEEESSEVTALQNIVTNYLQTLNFQMVLGETASTATDINLPEGGREVVEEVQPFTLAQFFTVAMTALFALFNAQAVSMKTVTEKRERVFNRIMLTNSKPIYYLMGKVVSTFIFVWMQVIIIFGTTQLLLDVFPNTSFEFWLGIILLTTAFALAVSGLTALFTPITLRLEDPNAANGIFTGIVIGLGMLGGSFFPLDFLPGWIQRLGSWTPNGLTQGTILKWIQYGNSQELIIPIMLLIAFFILCFLIGMYLFPRRERV